MIEKVKMIKDSQWMIEVSQKYELDAITTLGHKAGHTLVASIKLDAESAQEAVYKVQKAINVSETKDIFISNVYRTAAVDWDLTGRSI